MFDRIKRAWTELVRPVGPNVKALSSNSGLQSSNFYGSWGLVDGSRPDPTRPYEPLQAWDFSRSVTTWDYLQIRSQSRKLFANLGPIRSAVLQRVNYAFGRAWQPKFTGADAAWGDAATELLVEGWYPIADVRGYDFVTAIHIDNFCMDVDGDVLVLFSEDDDGWPVLSRVRAHRIKSSGNDDMYGTLQDGPYYLPAEQRFLSNGVIRDKAGRPLAYRVQTGGELGLGEPEFQDIDVADGMLLADPEFPDQPRGLPAYYAAMTDLMDLRHILGFQKQRSMLAATIGLIETNETGSPTNLVQLMQQAQPGNPTPFPIPPGVVTKEIMGGLVKYIRAGSGGKIETLYDRNPHENFEKFMQRLERQACEAIPWPFSLAIAPETLGGANARVAVGQAVRSVEDRQELFKIPWKRMIRYAIAKFISIGQLPEHPEWAKWEPTLPPKLTVDAGRDKAGDQNDYRLGIKNLGDILTEQGLDLDDQLSARAVEIAKRKLIAKKVGDQFGVEICDTDMCLLTINGNPTCGEEEPSPGTPPEEVPPKTEQESLPHIMEAS